MKRGLVYLAGMTVMALLAVFLFAPDKPGNEAASGQVLLLPGITDEINNVDHVEIIAAGNKTVASMHRVDGRWQLEQMNAYHVDWPKLQTLLADLGQAVVVENKTDKPDYYERLGVED